MQSFKTAGITGIVLVLFWFASTDAQCMYNLPINARAHSANKETASVPVMASQPSCAWTAKSNSNWITIDSGSSGTGSGVLVYTVSENLASAPRAGTLTIAGQMFSVTQAGASCSYSLSASSAAFSANADTGTINVIAIAGCAWTAKSNSNWITVISDSSGIGSGMVTYSVSANTGTSPRSGTITAAQQSFMVNQAGYSTGLQGNSRGSMRAGFNLDNYFAPFSASIVRISYSIPVRSQIRIAFYSVLGRNLVTLVEGEKLAGVYSAELCVNGLNSGIYYCTMATPVGIISREITVMK